MRSGVGVALLALLCACRSSPPTRYYTLSDIAPNTPPSASMPSWPAAAPGTRIRVDRVTIPGELDRPELVRRVESTQLHISGLDRWAAPLDEMIRRVLSADLAARLPAGMVGDISDPRPGHQPRSLSLDIQEFYGNSGCAVTLRASWLLSVPRAQDHGQGRPSAPIGATEEVYVPPAGVCPRALPDGMSRALADLSDRIAVAVNRSSL